MIPVDVLTGFLGSGKTTLLRHILSAPDYRDCAVLINEFGEIGLDHHLIADVQGDVVLMQSGCICCTIRGDLAAAMHDLLDRRQAGRVPAFTRLIIETTGLADPTPVLSTVMHEAVLRHHYGLGSVVTTVDAINGAAQLDRQPEAAKQAAVADRILITKTDLAPPAAVAALQARLARLNPAAAVFLSANAPPDAVLLLGVASADPGCHAARANPAAHAHQAHDTQHPHAAHDAGIAAFVLRVDAAVDWTLFGIWLTLLLHRHGDSVLRVKGLLDVGAAGPVVINGVQHVVHTPYHLPAWPDADRSSRLVFIVQDLPQAAIERSFAAFQTLAVTA